MGQYNSAIITNSGLALVTSAISGGGTIDFTAVKTSSYAYPAGTNIAGLTDLQDVVQTVEPYSAEVFNETMLQVSALFDNDEVASAYYINTIGLYAKIGSGNPVLFSVCQAVTPDQMPQHSDVSPSSFIYNIQTTVQQASQISVSTNPAGTATQQDILRLEEEKVDIDGGPVENTVVTFDDSGEVEGISTFQNFLDTVVSGIKIGTFFKNFVAGAKFILHTGSIINNLTTNDPAKVLSAAMGKDLQDQITQLNSDLFLKSEQRRMIYRGNNLGSTVTEEQKANIKNGTFKDFFLGDYWTIGSYTWRIVDFNYWYNCGDTAFTSPHLVIMPDKPLYNAQMNETNITTGGYVGSKMYTENLEQAKTLAASAFGSLILTRREYLTNAVSNGYPSAGAWFDSTLELPNEIMMYGSLVFTPAGDGTTVVNRYTTGKTQLALFTVVPKLISNRATFWLRDVVSSTAFAHVNTNGVTNCYDASYSHGVRPVFAIG